MNFDQTNDHMSIQSVLKYVFEDWATIFPNQSIRGL